EADHEPGPRRGVLCRIENLRRAGLEHLQRAFAAESGPRRYHSGRQSEHAESKGSESVPESAAGHVAQFLHSAATAIVAAVPGIYGIHAAEYSGRKGLVQLLPVERAEALFQGPLLHGVVHLLQKYSGAEFSESPGFGASTHDRSVRPDACAGDCPDL